MPQAGLTLEHAQVLHGAGWAPERLEWLHAWVVEVGGVMEGYRLTPRMQPVKVGEVAWYIHRDLTQPKALRCWANLPAGATVDAWTDGSGTAEDEAVGSAAVMLQKGELFDGSWDFSHSTYATDSKVSNNVAEITGIALAVANCPRSDLKLVVRSDSQYALGVVDATKNWTARKNTELVHEVRHMLQLRPAKLEHVPGHAGELFNEWADKIAGQARKKRATFAV